MYLSGPFPVREQDSFSSPRIISFRLLDAPVGPSLLHLSFHRQFEEGFVSFSGPCCPFPSKMFRSRQTTSNQYCRIKSSPKDRGLTTELAAPRFPCQRLFTDVEAADTLGEEMEESTCQKEGIALDCAELPLEYIHLMYQNSFYWSTDRSCV